MTGPPHTRRRRRSDALRNREHLLRSAITTIHREGIGVPLATIAEDAHVGIGTLYRHFASREKLLDELTHQSFELMLDRVRVASATPGTARQCLRVFLLGVIADRDVMLLPSNGGPPVRLDRTRAVQDDLHAVIVDVISRGAADGSICRKIDVFDIAWLGVSLAPVGRPDPGWTEVSTRLLDTYLAGLTFPG